MGNRELIVDPFSGRGFVFSTNGTSLGRPEFIFLDCPADQDLMVSCSKIISNYEESGTVPTDLEVIQVTPFDDDPRLSFIARVVTDDQDPLKKKLKSNYLYHKKAVHGIIVMIPKMQGEAADIWGQGMPAPLDDGEAAIDRWIEAMIARTGAYQQGERD